MAMKVSPKPGIEKTSLSLTDVRTIMTDIFQRYYRNNKLFLSLVGQWPYQSRGKRFFILACFMFLFTFQIIPQIRATVKFRDDQDIIDESLPPFLCILIFGSKFANIVINSSKMLKILQHIENDWISVAKQPDMHCILCEYAEKGRQFTIAYPVGLYSVMAIYLGQPLVPRFLEFIKPSNETLPKTFPFPVDYYGLDTDTYYYYLLAFMVSCNMICILMLTAADTMFVMQVQHACGMFTIVGYQLERMTNDITDEYADYPDSQFDPAFQQFSLCIKKHIDVIQFSNLLEASYTWAFFTNVGLGVLAISLAGLLTVQAMDASPKRAVRFATLVVAGMAYMFFQTLYAQKLINHSQQIGEHLCQAQWYRTSLATQKLIGFVAMKARVPCQLTAGKMMVMSLENFTVILKTSMSYFSVMRSSR